MKPKEIEVPFNRALELRTEGKLGEAISILAKLAETHPIAAVFGVMGDIHRQAGDIHNAIACFKQAVSLSPRSELASLNLFHSLLENRSVDDAITEMKRYLSVSRSEEYNRLLQIANGDLDQYSRSLKQHYMKS